jgi:arginine-tRNA-protein transferase
VGPHDERTKRLAQLIRRHAPPPGEEFPCPYLPGRRARQVVLLPTPLTQGLYHSLMDLNFRRLGPVFYRPACSGCDACRMIRVPVAAFSPSRAQRRCLRRNLDVRVETGTPLPTPEKHALYRRYLEARHDGQMDGSLIEFETFLYTSRLETLEFRYFAGDALLGVGIADVEPQALSAVYCYFEPAQHARSLGVLNVLTLIEEARRRGAAFVYLGYYVAGCAKMSYKTAYRPHELLGPDGRFTRAETAGS